MKIPFSNQLIYLFVALAVASPLLFGISLPPAQMKTADILFQKIQDLQPQPGKIAFVALDFGASTQAENAPQAEALLEHLFRKRIPFLLVSVTPFATPFLKNLPTSIAAKLNKETGENWTYGTDWVNLGYIPNPGVTIQNLAKSEDWLTQIQSDADGLPLTQFAATKNLKSIKDVLLLGEITGLVGALGFWIQYFQSDAYRPPFVHGCTSITIPDAYTYLASGQLVGVFEGLSGAAWYERILSQTFPKRTEGLAIKRNTSLSASQLLIVFLILLGNLVHFAPRWSKKK